MCFGQVTEVNVSTRIKSKSWMDVVDWIWYFSKLNLTSEYEDKQTRNEVSCCLYVLFDWLLYHFTTHGLETSVLTSWNNILWVQDRYTKTGQFPQHSSIMRSKAKRLFSNCTIVCVTACFILPVSPTSQLKPLLSSILLFKAKFIQYGCIISSPSPSPCHSCLS